MKIYTKTGDDGTTGLFSGKRVDKSSLRVEAYGTVDELNSIIGIAMSACGKDSLKADLVTVSNTLFVLGADLATPPEPKPKWEVKRVGEIHIVWLEGRIDEYTALMPELKNFILPGGSIVSAYLHQARTVCRRAERRAIALAAEESIGEFVVKYLNRLSDYLFTAARYANLLDGEEDIRAEF